MSNLAIGKPGPVKISRKLFVVAATLTLLTLLAMPNLAAPQGLTTLLATAHGQGTLKVGREVFKVSNVVVKLKEDGTGEITLITDLQLLRVPGPAPPISAMVSI